MNPIYFGSRRRRLFGIYESAQSPSRSSGAVLFCHAWGSDYINSYRAIAYAARRFAAAGFSTLRFDYFGSGDSEGESEEADLAGWEYDIETAIDELKEVAQTNAIALLGLRLGATLAARVVQRKGRAIKRLALWDPIVVGARYIDAVRSRERPRESTSDLAPAQQSAEIREFDGVRVSAGFLSALHAIEMANPAPALPQGTIIVTTDASAAASAEAFKTQPAFSCPGGVALASRLPPPWASASETASVLPVALLDQIIERWR